MVAYIYSENDHIQTLPNIAHDKIQFFNWKEKKLFLDNSAADIKIAILEPYYGDIQNFTELCKEFSSCDLVIVHSMEMTNSIFKLMQLFDKTNFVYIINGVLNTKLSNARVLSNIVWFHSASYYYQHELTKHHHTQLNPFVSKQYKFDVLYGQHRPHREFVKKTLESYKQKSWFYQSPFFIKNEDTAKINTSYHLDNTDFWENEIRPSLTDDYRCTYHDIDMNISQVIPYKVYNKTSYSLVCETSYQNDFSLFSEKIAKPLLSYRLFIAISGQHYLKNLKSLGFKTFDCVIDESYDNIANDEQRWSHALEQAVWLCDQDFNKVLKKITPILLHNYNMISRLDSSQLDRELTAFLITNGYHK